MSTAQKFSQSYVESEDRILLTIQTTEPSVLRLWLTQRLAVRLVVALASTLTQSDDAPRPPEHEATIQSWEQAAAVASYIPPEPVSDQHPRSVEAVVQEIDIARTPESITLNLRFGPGTGIIAPFAPVELRQWLSLLRKLFVRAEWSVTAWPDWAASESFGDHMATVN